MVSVFCHYFHTHQPISRCAWDMKSRVFNLSGLRNIGMDSSSPCGFSVHNSVYRVCVTRQFFLLFSVCQTEPLLKVVNADLSVCPSASLTHRGVTLAKFSTSNPLRSVEPPTAPSTDSPHADARPEPNPTSCGAVCVDFPHLTGRPHSKLFWCHNEAIITRRSNSTL